MMAGKPKTIPAVIWVAGIAMFGVMFAVAILSGGSGAADQVQEDGAGVAQTPAASVDDDAVE